MPTAWESEPITNWKDFNWEYAYRRNIIDWVMMYSGNQSSVLDIGCLHGQYIQKLRSLGFKGGYKGLDISPSFVALAKRYSRDEQFEVGNIHEVKEQDASFDLVLSSHVIDHLYHIEKPMAEVFRVARAYVTLSLLCSTGDSSINHDHDFVNHNYSIAEIFRNVPAGWQPLRTAFYRPEWDPKEYIFQGIWKKCA